MLEIEGITQFIKEAPLRWAGSGLLLKREGDYRGAVRKLSWALWFERRPEYYAWRGEALEGVGDYMGAVRDYSSAIALGTQSTRKYLRRRAWAHFQGGAFAGAERDLTRLLEDRPADGDCLHKRGLARERLGKFELAEQDFLSALGTGRKAMYVHASLAALYATCPSNEMRDAEKALHHSEKALELNHDRSWVAYSVSAAAWAEAGDFEKATQFARLAYDVAGPNDKPTRLERLRQYMQGKPFRRMTITPLTDEPH